jgi:hypothetical protein
MSQHPGDIPRSSSSAWLAAFRRLLVPDDLVLPFIVMLFHWSSRSVTTDNSNISKALWPDINLIGS